MSPLRVVRALIDVGASLFYVFALSVVLEREERHPADACKPRRSR